MDIKREQRFVIRYCVRRGLSAGDTEKEMRAVYKEECLGRATIFRWHKAFLEGRQSAELFPHAGPSCTVATEVNINTVAVAIREDRHLSVRALEEIIHIPKTTLHRILKDHLKMKRVCSAWVLHMLTREEMDKRVEVCRERLEEIEEDSDILDRIITCDESWVHHYDPLLKQESATWKTRTSPRKKKVRQSISAGKVMLMAFFDCRGMVYTHFVPPHTTINSQYYCDVLSKLREHVARKRPEIKKSWVLHHDNARPHTSQFTQAFVQKWKIQVAPHPPYSPDIAPCDYWLFPTLKKELRGKKFNSDADVQNAVQNVLKRIPADEFRKTIHEKWPERMQRCINSDGGYFEKDREPQEMDTDSE